MATASRSLTLSIVGDIDGLQKSLKQADTEIQGFGGKVGEFGKKVAAAFAVAAAAAGAYAIKLAVDGVKSAIEDEAAQLRLASALKTATGATNLQIAATEAYISKTSLATGVADDALRPAFQRLSVATGSLTKSQDLLNLAIDISKGTGKDLTSVVEALSKSYDGQDTQLVRLGIGLTATQAKTMDYKDQVQLLTDLYGGAAARNADTFAGKTEILKNRLNEAKETIGVALLPILTGLAEYLITNVVPAIESFISGLTGDKSLRVGFTDAQNSAFEFGEKVRGVITTIVNLKDQIIIVGSLLAGLFTASAIAGGISATIAAIKTLITAYNALKASSIVAGIASYFALNPLAGLGATAVAAGILSAANALARSSDVSTDFSTGGTAFTFGSGNPQFGLDQGAGGGGGGFGGGGGAGGGGAGGGSFGGGGGISTPTGATSLKDLADKLLNVQNRFTDLTFQVATGGIGKTAAQKQFDQLQAEFRVLEKQGKTLSANPNIVVNVTGAIDPNGTARAIANVLNEATARSNGLLVGGTVGR